MIRPRHSYPIRASAEYPAAAHLYSEGVLEGRSRRPSRPKTPSSTQQQSDSPLSEAGVGTSPSITPYDEIWYLGYPVRP
jgi:hypothetical protein